MRRAFAAVEIVLILACIFQKLGRTVAKLTNVTVDDADGHIAYSSDWKKSDDEGPKLGWQARGNMPHTWHYTMTGSTGYQGTANFSFTGMFAIFPEG